MNFDRRNLLALAGSTLAIGAIPIAAEASPSAAKRLTHGSNVFSVRDYGAVGDGTIIDTPAVNRAIQAAADAGGGTVLFPAGTYACYSIHLRSRVRLYLDPGATILGASPRAGSASEGYDAAEPQGPWEPYQDYGHNHWHNSLIWGEGLRDVSIEGPGSIYGKGLLRGHHGTVPGSGNKSIALKNCVGVILRDFSILQGGWFGVLATGVDNLTIDNLRVDTNRDGMDIDCCRNVRIANTTVNSPWDDGICLKSSYALGEARASENVTISNCYVTGGYALGSVLDGTWKLMDGKHHTGRIKCGTESNGGFLNITVNNCVLDRCKGFALETVDGADLEEIAISNISMRNMEAAPPFFLRLGARLRGPAGAKPGRLRRVMLSNLVCTSASQLPCIIAGIPGHPIEDIKINELHFEQPGGPAGTSAGPNPPENVDGYPRPTMFGALPASGMFLRHVRNLQASNIEIVTASPDVRPAFWLEDVDGADFFRSSIPTGAAAFDLRDVSGFRSFGSRGIPDVQFESAQSRKIG